jgi:hypothetical protein
MSSLVLNGDTSGALTLAAPAIAGTNTATLPAATGTVMVSGNMPAFSVYLSANQSVTSGVATKISFDTKEFDTNSNFASNRFTPTVAGYYQVNASVYLTGTANTQGIVAIYLYKNGSNYKQGGVYINNSTAGSSFDLTVASVVYMNGSSDYLEVYGYNTQTLPVFSGGSNQTYFNGSLIRSA